ncbi:hypothetical protein HNY73_015612 [Argiope bruennichi]|uniref:Uncharacterized protein n=1 Tax=Argiope bruennichi TaxID=94029 RepID=A0A8T0EU39_ARGBR|nr:hypothetical protein HNY73_015612 [Argiope bruennichi]
MKPVFSPVGYLFLPCYSKNLLINSTYESDKIPLRLAYQANSFSSYDLNIEASEEIYFLDKPTAFVAVHSPFVPVKLPYQGKQLKPGYKYHIIIRMEEDKLLPSPYKTNCTDYEILWKENKRQGPRSQEMCKELCLHDRFEPNKNISLPFHMLEYPLELCFGAKCMTSSKDEEILERCKRDCKPSCRNLKYTFTIHETLLGNSKKENIDYDSQKDKIQVDISLGDRQVVVQRHVPEYTTGYLFSYIGGLMGCWLGVSIWAFAGIAENTFLRAIQWMEHIKRHFKESFAEQPTVFSIRQNNGLIIKDS